jgi:hypothetical protein
MIPMMDEEDSQVPIWSYRVNLDKRVRDIIHYGGSGRLQI